MRGPFAADEDYKSRLSLLIILDRKANSVVPKRVNTQNAEPRLRGRAGFHKANEVVRSCRPGAGWDWG